MEMAVYLTLPGGLGIIYLVMICTLRAVGFLQNKKPMVHKILIVKQGGSL